jgi:anti-anti-sigma factor
MAPGLRVTTAEKEDIAVLSVDGYIDAATVSEFEASIQDVLNREQFHIILNCSGLSYINSSGLGVLMGSIDTIETNQGFLYLCNMNPTVYKIFDTLGFTQLFPVFEQEQEAILSGLELLQNQQMNTNE